MEGMKIKSYFISVYEYCRMFQWCDMVRTMVLSSGNTFILPLHYRKPEALATNTNSKDNKPLEEEYLQENESTLS
jgi:hypothetical protein